MPPSHRIACRAGCAPSGRERYVTLVLCHDSTPLVGTYVCSFALRRSAVWIRSRSRVRSFNLVPDRRERTGHFLVLSKEEEDNVRCSECTHKSTVISYVLSLARDYRGRTNKKSVAESLRRPDRMAEKTSGERYRSGKKAWTPQTKT